MSPFVVGASSRSIVLRLGMVLLMSEEREQVEKCARNSKSASGWFKDAFHKPKMNCNFQRLGEKFKDFAKKSKKSLNCETSLNFSEHLWMCRKWPMKRKKLMWNSKMSLNWFKDFVEKAKMFGIVQIKQLKFEKNLWKFKEIFEFSKKSLKKFKELLEKFKDLCAFKDFGL